MKFNTARTGLVIGIAAALLAGPALAQSVMERAVQLYSSSDEFYFFEDDRKQVVDYKEPRMVRICSGESRHLVPLKVTYDGKSAMLHSGDCMRVEAKKVALEPAEQLDPNWAIYADVDTLD